MTNGAEGSDPAIVAMKPANKSSSGDAERAERRAGTEGTPEQQSTCRTQSRESVTQALDCQSALNIDPLSASKIDPPRHGGLCR